MLQNSRELCHDECTVARPCTSKAHNKTPHMGMPTYGQSAIVQYGSEKQRLQLTFRILCNESSRSAQQSTRIVLCQDFFQKI